jgi:TP901 family phage tail tape measure protein
VAAELEHISIRATIDRSQIDKVLEEIRQVIKTKMEEAAKAFDAAGKKGTAALVEVSASAKKAGDAVANAGKTSVASLTAMESAGKRFSDSLDKAKISLAVLAATSSFALRSVIESFGNFEQSMARVRALSGATEEQFGSLQQKALQLGRDTVFTAKEAADAMGNLALAGLNTNEILAASGPTLDLAAAAQIGIADAATITARILRGYGHDARQLSADVDILTVAFTRSNTDIRALGEAFRQAGPVAAALNRDFTETTAILSKLADAGFQGSLGGNALKRILSDLVAPTKTAQNELKKFGIEAKEINLQTRDFSEVIDLFKEKTAGFAESDIGALAFAVFGQRGAPAFLALMEQGGQSIRDFTVLLEKASGTAERIRKIQLDTVFGQFELLRSAAENLTIKLGRGLEPFLKVLARTFTTLVIAVGELPEELLQIVAVVGAVATGIIAFAAAVAGAQFAMAGLGPLLLATRGYFLGLAVSANISSASILYMSNVAFAALIGKLLALTLVIVPVINGLRVLWEQTKENTAATDDASRSMGAFGLAARLVAASFKALALVVKVVSNLFSFDLRKAFAAFRIIGNGISIIAVGMVAAFAGVSEEVLKFLGVLGRGALSVAEFTGVGEGLARQFNEGIRLSIAGTRNVMDAAGASIHQTQQESEALLDTLTEGASATDEMNDLQAKLDEIMGEVTERANALTKSLGDVGRAGSTARKSLEDLKKTLEALNGILLESQKRTTGAEPGLAGDIAKIGGDTATAQQQLERTLEAAERAAAIAGRSRDSRVRAEATAQIQAIRTRGREVHDQLIGEIRTRTQLLIDERVQATERELESVRREREKLTEETRREQLRNIGQETEARRREISESADQEIAAAKAAFSKRRDALKAEADSLSRSTGVARGTGPQALEAEAATRATRVGPVSDEERRSDEVRIAQIKALVEREIQIKKDEDEELGNIAAITARRDERLAQLEIERVRRVIQERTTLRQKELEERAEAERIILERRIAEAPSEEEAARFRTQLERVNEQTTLALNELAKENLATIAATEQTVLNGTERLKNDRIEAERAVTTATTEAARARISVNEAETASILTTVDADRIRQESARNTREETERQNSAFEEQRLRQREAITSDVISKMSVAEDRRTETIIRARFKESEAEQKVSDLTDNLSKLGTERTLTAARRRLEIHRELEAATLSLSAARNDRETAESDAQLQRFKEQQEFTTAIFGVTLLTVENGMVQFGNIGEQIFTNVQNLAVETLNSIGQTIINTLVTEVTNAIVTMALTGSLSFAAMGESIKATVLSIKAAVPELLVITAVLTGILLLFNHIRRRRAESEAPSNVVSASGNTTGGEASFGTPTSSAKPQSISEFARTANSVVQQFNIRVDIGQEFNANGLGELQKVTRESILQAAPDFVPILKEKILQHFALQNVSFGAR